MSLKVALYTAACVLAIAAGSYTAASAGKDPAVFAITNGEWRVLVLALCGYLVACWTFFTLLTQVSNYIARIPHSLMDPMIFLMMFTGGAGMEAGVEYPRSTLFSLFCAAFSFLASYAPGLPWFKIRWTENSVY